MTLGTGTPPPPPARAAISALDVLMVTFGIIAATLLGAVLLGQMIGAVTTDKVVLQLALYALHPMVFLGAIYALLIRSGRYQWRDLGVVPADPRWARIGMLIGLALVPTVYVIVYVVHMIVGGDQPRGATIVQPNRGTLQFWLNYATLCLYIGILIPIAEELFFRGVVFSWLRSRFDFWPANLATALAFGLVHLQSVEISVALVAAGVVLGWLYEKSGSVIPAILAHQIFNFAGMAMLLFA